MVTDSEDLTIGFRDGCDAVLEGYLRSLKEGGCPFVLAKHEKNLERLGIEAIKSPHELDWDENQLGAGRAPNCCNCFSSLELLAND